MSQDPVLRGVVRVAAVAIGVVVLLAVALVVVAGSAGAQDEPPPVATDRVLVTNTPEHERNQPLVVDEMAPSTVLTIGATGFDADTTGRLAQCLDGDLCRNHLPIRTNGTGAATLQYLVTDAVGLAGGNDERCRLGETRCTIEIRVGDDIAVIETVFVDAAPPPGRLRVEPSRGLLVGDELTVTAVRFPPEAELRVLVCAAPSTRGDRCSSVGGPVVTDGDGSAELTVRVPASVGDDDVACGRRTRCQVVASSSDAGVQASPAQLRFQTAPGADYDSTRVALGVVTAVALLAAAAWLVRSTDWLPPPEADGSAIDLAEFADLDLEADLFSDPEPAPTT